MIFSGLIKIDAMKIPMPVRKNLVSMTKKVPSNRTKTDNAPGVRFNHASHMTMIVGRNAPRSNQRGWPCEGLEHELLII